MGANPHKGEVEFQAGGEARTLRFGTNELCELEAELGLSTDQIIASFSNSPSITMLRSMFRVGAGGLAPSEAGELIDEIGFRQVSELITKALRLAFPPAQTGSRPRKGGEAGTGKDS